MHIVNSLIIQRSTIKRDRPPTRSVEEALSQRQPESYVSLDQFNHLPGISGKQFWCKNYKCTRRTKILCTKSFIA